MHVLYIHQHFGTPRGSFGTRSYEFACRLRDAGHTVTMICGGSERSETGLESPFVKGRREGRVEGIEVIEYQIGYSTGDSIGRRIAKFTRFGIEATRAALTRDYDIIFATSTPLTAAIPGIFARWLRRKPFVFEVRDLWPELPKALGVSNPVILWGMSVLEWVAYHSAHRVIGLAPGIVKGVERRGIPPGRTVLIPNGCDMRLFDSFAEEARPGHSREFVCVYAGAHGIANGLDVLIPVAEELRRRGREDIRLVLVGSGGTKEPIRRRALALGLTNILFLDPRPKTELIPFLKAADAGLQILKNVPAFYDGTSPNKFFDYLAAGIPVVVNYPGWVAKMVAENDCGSLVPADDAHAFADALVAAADSGPVWRAKRLNSRRLGASFDRDILGARFVAVLEEAVSREAGKGP